MSSYFRFWRPLSPPPHKISNTIIIYLPSYRILAPPPPPHLPVIKIMKCCGIWGRNNGAPFSVIKIVKYCGVWGGGGGIGGRQNPMKDNGVPSLCH